MYRARKVLNWVMLGLFLVSAFVMNASYVDAGGPGSFILALPFATALAVYHFSPDRWFVWVAFAINFLVAVGLVAVLAGLFFSGGGDLGGPLVIFLLVGIPTGLNAFSFWLLLARMKTSRTIEQPQGGE